MDAFKRYRVEGTIIDGFSGKSYGRFSKETSAPSAGKAKNNVLYHAKKQMRLASNCQAKWYTDVKVSEI